MKGIDMANFNLNEIPDEELREKFWKDFRINFTPDQIPRLRKILQPYTKKAKSLDDVIMNIHRWKKALKGVLN